MAISGQMFVNGSAEWLGVPAPFFNTGVAWTDNLLAHKVCWGDRVRVGDLVWGTQREVIIGDNVPWRSDAPDCLVYLTRSPPENTRATVRHVHDACLW